MQQQPHEHTSYSFNISTAASFCGTPSILKLSPNALSQWSYTKLICLLHMSFHMHALNNSTCTAFCLLSFLDTCILCDEFVRFRLILGLCHTYWISRNWTYQHDLVEFLVDCNQANKWNPSKFIISGCKSLITQCRNDVVITTSTATMF